MASVLIHHPQSFKYLPQLGKQFGEIKRRFPILVPTDGLMYAVLGIAKRIRNKN